jgi:hypothetical protein
MFFVLRGTLKYLKWSANQESLETPVLVINVLFIDKFQYSRSEIVKRIFHELREKPSLLKYVSKYEKIRKGWSKNGVTKCKYSVFQGFRQAESANGGSILS